MLSLKLLEFCGKTLQRQVLVRVFGPLSHGDYDHGFKMFVNPVNNTVLSVVGVHSKEILMPDYRPTLLWKRIFFQFHGTYCKDILL